ncbi:MAG: DUF1588 domain-containing protein, partial [Planctomycetota bacterium]
RMMDDPRCVQQSLRFVDQWLNLDRLKFLQPDQSRFPHWQPKLAAAMRAETLDTAREILWNRGLPIQAIVSEPVTIVNRPLAEYYSLDWQEGTPRDDGTKLFDLRSHPTRHGLLTQGSVLTIGGDDASMVTRGLFVMQQLLRGVVNDPPPCVDTTPVEGQPGVSQRMISDQRVAAQACGGCHTRFEPLAHGLEAYDGLGYFQKEDHYGNATRSDGMILIPTTNQSKKFQSTRQMVRILGDSDRVSHSLVWQIAQFAMGRPLTATDQPLVDDIHRRAMQSGGRYRDVSAEIAASPLMQTP